MDRTDEGLLGDSWLGQRGRQGGCAGGAAGGEQAHHGIPGEEHVVGGYDSQVLKEAAFGAKAVAYLLPERFCEFACAVEGEGAQVEDDEHAGEGALAMAEVVFEVITVLFEDVEGFVLDLPSSAGAVGEFDDIVAVDG